MDYRQLRWLAAFLLITSNIKLSQCQDNNSSLDKNPEKIKKLSLNTDKKKIKKLSVKSKIDSDDEETVPTTTSSTTTEASPEPETNPEPELEFSNTEEKLLYNLLLTRRGLKKGRPVKNWTDPVTVKMGMALIHMDLDEKNSVLEIDAWMRFTWQDEFLTWSTEEYDGISQVHLNRWDIWRPDIHLYNNAVSNSPCSAYTSIPYVIYVLFYILFYLF